jgi:hypothetical protein
MSDHSAQLEMTSAMLSESELFSHPSPSKPSAAAHYLGIDNIAEDEVVLNEGDIDSFMCIVHSRGDGNLPWARPLPVLDITLCVQGD